jgi:hypothetical protein
VTDRVSRRAEKSMGSPAEVRSKRPAIGTPIFLMLSVRPIRRSSSHGWKFRHQSRPVRQLVQRLRPPTHAPAGRARPSSHQFRRPRSQLEAALTQRSHAEGDRLCGSPLSLLVQYTRSLSVLPDLHGSCLFRVTPGRQASFVLPRASGPARDRHTSSVMLCRRLLWAVKAISRLQ